MCENNPLCSAGKKIYARAVCTDLGAAVLGVTRIQHGVRAVEDPAVVRLAAERGVTFDVCPLSNVGLRVVPSLRDHPLPRLLAAGVRCTVSTDDPLCFANTLTEEYAVRSKGDAYREYQRTTSAFVPWFRKSSKP